MLSLGNWQLQRAEEKTQMLAEFNQRMSSDPIKLVDIYQNEGWQPYQRIELEGQYLSDFNFYLDNQIVDGKAGFDIITPFRMANNQLVLINRGFISRTRDYNVLPELDKLVENTLLLSGYVYIPVGEVLLLGPPTNAQEGWPKVVQVADTKIMSELLGLDVFPYIIRLDEGQAGILRRHWKITSVKPEKHQAYAFQWFSMAIALVILWLSFSIRKNK